MKLLYTAKGVPSICLNALDTNLLEEINPNDINQEDLITGNAEDYPNQKINIVSKIGYLRRNEAEKL